MVGEKIMKPEDIEKIIDEKYRGYLEQKLDLLFDVSETEGELSAIPEKSASKEKASLISIALSGSIKVFSHLRSIRGMSKATL